MDDQTVQLSQLSRDELPLLPLLPEDVRTRLLLLSLSGSRAYGLEHEGSDHDFIGVYAATDEQLTGLDLPESSFRRRDGNFEGQIFELQSFASQLAAGSPNMTEVLWSENQWLLRHSRQFGHGPQYSVLDRFFGARQEFVTKTLCKRTLSWGARQLDEAASGRSNPRKRFVHALRLLHRVTDMIETGTFGDLRALPDLQERIDEFLAEVDVDADNAVKRLNCGFTRAKEQVQYSALPDAVARSFVSDLLRDTRRELRVIELPA